MNKSRELSEGAIFTTLYIILLVLSVYTPLGMISIYIIPVPFIIYGYRNRFKLATVWFIFANIILATLLASIYGFFLTILATITGIVMGTLYKRSSALMAVVGGIIATIANFIIILVLSKILFNINLVDTLQQLLNYFLQGTEKLLGTNNKQTKDLLNSYQAVLNNIGQILPFMMISYAMFIVFINHVITGLIMKARGTQVPKLPPLREWNFPRSVIVYYLITVSILLINPDSNALKIIAMNLYPLLQIILIIQGVTFVYYYAHLKKLGNALPIITLISAFLPIISQLIHVIGIVDIGFNLRKKLKA